MPPIAPPRRAPTAPRDDGKEGRFHTKAVCHSHFQPPLSSSASCQHTISARISCSQNGTLAGVQPRDADAARSHAIASSYAAVYVPPAPTQSFNHSTIQPFNHSKGNTNGDVRKTNAGKMPTNYFLFFAQIFHCFVAKTKKTFHLSSEHWFSLPLPHQDQGEDQGGGAGGAYRGQIMILPLVMLAIFVYSPSINSYRFFFASRETDYCYAWVSSTSLPFSTLSFTLLAKNKINYKAAFTLKKKHQLVPRGERCFHFLLSTTKRQVFTKNKTNLY